MTAYKLPNIPLSVVGKTASLRVDGLLAAHGKITELVLTGNVSVSCSAQITFDHGLIKTWHNTRDDATLEVED